MTKLEDLNGSKNDKDIDALEELKDLEESASDDFLDKVKNSIERRVMAKEGLSLGFEGWLQALFEYARAVFEVFGSRGTTHSKKEEDHD